MSLREDKFRWGQNCRFSHHWWLLQVMRCSRWIWIESALVLILFRESQYLLRQMRLSREPWHIWYVLYSCRERQYVKAYYFYIIIWLWWHRCEFSGLHAWGYIEGGGIKWPETSIFIYKPPNLLCATAIDWSVHCILVHSSDCTISPHPRFNTPRRFGASRLGLRTTHLYGNAAFVCVITKNAVKWTENATAIPTRRGFQIITARWHGHLRHEAGM